jgi:SNF2 family DNA or RNA helicase
MDPGLGKTSCALQAFKILRDLGYVRRALVIAPLRPMLHTWTAEIDKWSNFQHLVYDVLHGKNKEKAASSPEGTDLFLINPEGLQWLLGRSIKNFSDKKLRQLGVDMLIVDESTKFKHSNTTRFKLLRKALNVFKRRYILTGTVSPNGLMDLFGQFYILDGGNALGAYITHFRSKYFSQPNPIHEPYKWEANEGAMQEIAERIDPLCLRLKAEDYLDMPELQHINLNVKLPDKAMQHYLEMENEFITKLEEDIAYAENAATVGIKCRQIANGAVYTDGENYEIVHDTKIERLKELTEELQGEPLLLLYEFRHDLERIKEAYPDLMYFGMKGIKEEVIVQRWNAGELSILAGHPASMGHGLNLQGSCHRVCWFGITWNFEYYDQAIARVYRQGQKSDRVLNYHIVAEDTLDEKVLRVLQQKERTQEDLLDMLKS